MTADARNKLDALIQKAGLPLVMDTPHGHPDLLDCDGLILPVANYKTQRGTWAFTDYASRHLCFLAANALPVLVEAMRQVSALEPSAYIPNCTCRGCKATAIARAALEQIERMVGDESAAGRDV